MISVLIPTANRPEFLRTALMSVQRQSALKSITEVIVSENAGNPASGQICKDFDSLPIRYIYRHPQTEAIEHFSLLFRDAQNDLIALLFDDDWWAVDHIKNSLRHFAAPSDVSCYYSAYFIVRSEACSLQCHPTLEFWTGSGFQSIEDHWKLTLSDIAVSCLVDVPCSYSTMVGPSEYIRKAWHTVVQSGNKYDTDRTLALELARLGAIIVNSTPEVFVRFHPQQDKNRYTNEQIKKFKNASLHYLINVCRKQQINLGAEFDLRLASAADTDITAVCEAIINNYECVILENLIESRVLFRYWKATRSQVNHPRKSESIRKLMKQVLPPFVASFARMILKKKF